MNYHSRHNSQDQFIRNLTAARPFCRTCPKDSGCHCGESPDAVFEWDLTDARLSQTTKVSTDKRNLKFHETYSVGTAACRGAVPLVQGKHHFWEVRMTSPVYGTSVMVGVATADADIFGFENKFENVLGLDDKSWGFSYLGTLSHGGQNQWPYSDYKWSEGTIIGIHLDRWRGTLEFYLNRKPLGIAFFNIPSDLELFPVITSTAAKSSMRLICTQSYRCDLAFECVRAISQFRSADPNLQFGSSILKGDTMMAKTRNLLMNLPPGLAKFVDNNCWYLLGTRLDSVNHVQPPFQEKPELREQSSASDWKILSTDDEDADVEGSVFFDSDDTTKMGYPPLPNSSASKKATPRMISPAPPNSRTSPEGAGGADGSNDDDSDEEPFGHTTSYASRVTNGHLLKVSLIGKSNSPKSQDSSRKKRFVIQGVKKIK